MPGTDGKGPRKEGTTALQLASEFGNVALKGRLVLMLGADMREITLDASSHFGVLSGQAIARNEDRIRDLDDRIFTLETAIQSQIKALCSTTTYRN